jgi:ATP-binding cassette subfamily B protein AbcA/BmrA
MDSKKFILHVLDVVENKLNIFKVLLLSIGLTAIEPLSYFIVIYFYHSNIHNVLVLFVCVLGLFAIYSFFSNERQKISSVLFSDMKKAVIRKIFHNIHHHRLSKQSNDESNFLTQIDEVEKLIQSVLYDLIPVVFVFCCIAGLSIFTQKYHILDHNMIFVMLLSDVIKFDKAQHFNHNMLNTLHHNFAKKFGNLQTENLFGYTNPNNQNLINNMHHTITKHDYNTSYEIQILCLFYGMCLMFGLDQVESIAFVLMNLIFNVKHIHVFTNTLNYINHLLVKLVNINTYLLSLMNNQQTYELDYLNPTGNIEIVNLSYTTPDLFTVKNINISIKKGEKIAVFSMIDINGFFDILGGLKRNYSGSVYMNNVNIAYVSAQAIRKNGSYIMQKLNLIDNITIKENILMGSTVNDLSNILHTVQLSNRIELLPNGLNTMANEYLSTCITDRLCIARSLIELETKHLLLANNIQMMQFGMFLDILKLCEHKTIIATNVDNHFLRFMNKVLFIDINGESYYGNHNDLMTNNERYRKFIGN